MEQTIVKLQRQYHLLEVDCNEQKKYILGRDIRRGQVLEANCDFVRCKSEFVSRKHVEIFSDSHGIWKIKDLESMNGTFLGSTRLAPGQLRELRNRDLIGLGISGEGPFEDNIIISDPNYYIFKFIEERISSDTEIIDLTDNDDACTVVSTPSTRSFPTTPSKKQSKSKKAHNLDQPTTSASVNAELHKPTRDGRGKNKRNGDTDSLHSSSSKENKNYRRSRSRSISPKNRFKNKHDKPNFATNYLSTSSEDDSSDGLPELRESIASPTSLSSKSGSSVTFEKQKSSSKPLKEENHYTKPFQVSSKSTSTKTVTNLTKHKDEHNEQPKYSAHSTAKITSTKYTGKEYLPCFVKLNNVFQVNKSGNLFLTPSANKLLAKDSCFFSQLSHEDQHVSSADCRGSANIPNRKEKRRCKESDDNSSDSDIDILPHPPKKQKQMYKKVKVMSESDDEDERIKEAKRPKEKDKIQIYRPGPLSKSKAQACVKPIRREQNDDKREELIKKARLVEKDENILLPIEYTRSNSDDEPEDDYADDVIDLPMDIDPVEDEEEMDEDEPMEAVEAESSDSLSRIISHSNSKARVQQRQIKIIDEPPPSPINRRRRGAGPVDRVSVIPPGALPVKPISDWRNTDPVCGAQKRLERLKEIANDSAKKKLQNQEEIFKKPASVPKVKNSHKTRSESLLMEMVGGSKAAVENLEKQMKNVVESSMKAPEAAPAQHRELPQPAPEDVAKMPLHNLLKHKLHAPSVQDARGEKIIPPVARSNPLQKPNAIVHPSPEANNDKVQFHIHNKKAVPGPLHRNVNPEASVLLEDTIYKDICHWVPTWLEEQKKYDSPPPVEEGFYRPKWDVINVLSCYSNFEAYLTVYYPLMLHELWASIQNDVVSHEKDPSFQLKIGIERYLQQDICPLTPQMELGLRQGQWVDARCHVLVNHRKDFKMDLDLCLLTYTTKTRNKKNEEKFSEKSTFAFLHSFNTVKYEEIKSKTMVHNNLYQQNPNFKLKVTFSVAFHIKVPPESFYIATERTAILKKLAYIGPTLRNYKALINLPKFPLYNNILKPQKPDNPWHFNEHARYDSLVSYCNSLNPRQKSVVDYVTNRIMKTPKKPDIMLIHGPPGTGKTRTIVGIILQIITSQEFKRENPKILVCTPSNTAVDEIISRLHEIFKNMKEDQRPSLVRIGDVNKVSGTATQYSADCIASRKMTNASAYDSIAITIDQKRVEMKEKEREKATLMREGGPGRMTRLKALDREIKEIKTEIDRLENNKKLVLTATRADQEQVEKVKTSVIMSAQIICSTLSHCSNSRLKNMFDVVHRKPNSGKPLPKFTFCIVDEATQTTEPETLAPLTFNIEKLVLVGDPMQLDATVLSQKAKENLYGRSLYHRLYDTYSKMDPSPVMMLRDQYRMHEEILKWPNDSFYGGKLIKKPIRKNHVPCPLAPYLFFNLISRESADKGNISNEEEILFIIEMLKSIWIKLNQHKFSIGVITPYGRQKDILSRTIRDKVPDMSDMVEVDTVDSFQGREKDIVLISCVRTNSIGFLNNPKRLNVALTRAVHSLFIIGNAECLKKDDMWESLIDDAECRKLIHTVPTDKTKQPGLLANILNPIISSPRKSF